MYDQPPESQSASQSTDSSTRNRNSLDFDEMIALVVAFLAIGSILWWGLTRNNGLLKAENLSLLSDSSALDGASVATGDNADGDGQTILGGDTASDTGSASDDQAGTQGPFSLLSFLNPSDEPATTGIAASSFTVGTNTETGETPESTDAEDTADTADADAAPSTEAETSLTPPAPEKPTEAPSAPTATPAPDSEFSEQETSVPPPIDISDVPADHWAYPFVSALHAKGIIPDFPDGKFEPDQPVTRADLAALIQQAFTQDAGQRSLSFTDIPDNFWAATAIDKAVKSEFMSGYPDGVFRPKLEIPRYQVLVALASGLKLSEPANADEIVATYTDQAGLPDWAIAKVAAATESSLVVGHPDASLLRPEVPATRAEVAVMIYQALLQAEAVEPIESEFILQR
ncbi:MAG: S-layer homology domain-containing protein [Cyanothece sp. SIO1E1]|nr:S-layer homology domain-containing protein [Cyanothece sp. SIO1E1]